MEGGGVADLGEEMPEAGGGEVDVGWRAAEGGLGGLDPGGQAAPAPASGAEAVRVGRQAQALREGREVVAVPPGRDGGLELGPETVDGGETVAGLEELQELLSVDGVPNVASCPFGRVQDRRGLLPVPVEDVLLQLESIFCSLVSNKCNARFTLKAPC
jgi:hypothetical protein